MEVPRRIETDRLVIRPWTEADAPRVKAAVDRSLPELKRWMPWAEREPTPVGDFVERFARFQAAFDAGEEWFLGILTADESEVVGATGFHPRIASGGLEIGYWIRSDLTGRGYATEAVAALTKLAFTLPGVEFLEIRCQVGNEPSRRIPARLGYTMVEVLEQCVSAPDVPPRDLEVWRLDRAGLVG